MRGRLLIEELSTKLTADIEVSESQLEEYYTENKEKFVQPEQVEASHILVESLAEAEELKSDLDDGADFAELAKEHSIGPSSQEGGSLGLFAKGQMVPAFEEAAFSLEKEEISDPVETEYGYHLIKVSDKVASRELDLEEVRDDLENYLIEGEKNQLLNDYFEDVYQETEIERMVDFS
nr:peptidylprolyl isomerase [Fuchsiella alkaliacetigena]